MNKTYQIMPDLSPEDYAELKTDIAERGVQVAVEYDEYDNILDGHSRVQICIELGITEWPKVIRVGMTEEQKREHARKLNMARRHLTREQRQELIRQQLIDTPEKSDRQIAAALGVDNSTVSRTRQKMEEGGEVLQCNTSIGADGKEYPRQVERKPITIFEPTESKIEDAKNLVENAAPELVEAVATGKVPLGQAAAVAQYATVAQQAEAVKRVETGDAPYLMEGYNQQKAEESWNLTKEQRQQAETNIREADKKIDREYRLSMQIDKAIEAVLLIKERDIEEAVQFWLKHMIGFSDRDEAISDLSRCIEKLQTIKRGFLNIKPLRVVK